MRNKPLMKRKPRVWRNDNQSKKAALSNKRSGVQYAAAKTDRLTGPWQATDASVNRIINASSPAIRRRVRQLVRDFPYFARAVNMITDYTVGCGIIPQAKLRDADGKLNRPVNQAIEDAWKFFGDEADVAGKLHVNDMMALAKRQDVEAGEFVLVKRYRPNAGRYVPLALQMFEADWLSGKPAAGKLAAAGFDQGIEFDRETGEVGAYHFTDPDGWGKPVRIDAGHVLHGFATLRPGQQRGVTPFAAAVLVAHDLSTLMDAEMDAAKMASKYLGFIKTTQPAAHGGWDTDADDDDDERYVEEMENAMLKVLLPNEDVTIASNPRPGSNFPPYVRLILCMISVTTGIPYELLSGDYQGMNFSTAKIVRTDFAHSLRPISVRHVRQFCQPVFNAFLDQAVTVGRVSLPGYFGNKHPYRRVRWQLPGMESIDPLRETKALVDQETAGHRSPQEITGVRGRDLEDVYKEIAEARQMAKELGLEFSKPSTALANNPAAVAGDDDDKEGDS